MIETHVELAIPARIMQVAFELFDSGDEHVLLKLPLEERAILQQALARPEAKTVQAEKTRARKPKSTK